MGAYLNKPETSKNSSNGSLSINGQQCLYGQTAMQGWRSGMEDSYMIVPDFGEAGPLLGVFDGHGGKEVAVYCSKYFPDILRDSRCYQDGDIKRGLSQAFMNCDRKLLTSEAINEMKTMSDHDIPMTTDDATNEEELEQLSREADMPLENVLQACMEDKKLLKYMVNMANREEQEESEDDDDDESSDEDTSVEETQRSKLYSKFIKELTSQYKPALNELQEYMGGGDDDSESDEEEEEKEEEEEEEEEGEEEKALKRDEAATIRDTSSSDPMILRKRTRTDLLLQTPTSTTSSASKRAKLDEHEEENEESKVINEKKQTDKENDEAIGVEDKINLETDQEVEVIRDPEGFESGTTATVCLVRKDTIFVANAGDSRCVLSCNGKAVDLSLDHKPLHPLEKNRIEKAGGHVDEDLRVDGGLNMSRAIGDHMYKVNDQLSLEEQMITAYPDVLIRCMTSDDEFLVLASDGIWNCMDSPEVVEFIRKKLMNINNISSKEDIGSHLSLICEELCDSCLAEDIDNDGTGCDNMTIILTLLKPLEKIFNKSL